MLKHVHVDQVGSLNRPSYLLAARHDFKEGKTSREDLAAVEDKAIAEALEAQKNIGVAVLSDGEMRRDGWQSELSASFDGFTKDYPAWDTDMPDGSKKKIEHHSKIVVAPLRRRRHLLETSLPLLKEHAGDSFKVTMPSPAAAAKASFRSGETDAVYATRNDLLQALTELYLNEMDYLGAENVPYVQLDEGFAFYIHDGFRERATVEGWDAEEQLEKDIAAENQLWDSLPQGVIRAAHLCRGNRTRGGGRGSYDWLAERLFDSLHVDRFLLEYDTDRAGGFEGLRNLPRDKMVILGLVSSKYGELEPPASILTRIEEAAKYCPVEQLGLSAQCGFGGSDDKNHMSIDEQWRKFELIRSVAESVWN